MTERIPWWKAFLIKKKPTGPKDASVPHTLDPDFDPFAPRPEKPKDAQQDSSKKSSHVSDDTHDESHLESVFNEQTFSRNMMVSRSGRFKEKRKVRSSLPIQEKETQGHASGREDKR